MQASRLLSAILVSLALTFTALAAGGCTATGDHTASHMNGYGGGGGY